MNTVTYLNVEYLILASEKVVPGVTANIFEILNQVKAGRTYLAEITYPDGVKNIVYAVNFPVYHLDGSTPWKWEFYPVESLLEYLEALERHTKAFEDHARQEYKNLWTVAAQTVGFLLTQDPQYRRQMGSLERQAINGTKSWHKVFSELKAYLNSLATELMDFLPPEKNRKFLNSLLSEGGKEIQVLYIIKACLYKEPAELLGFSKTQPVPTEEPCPQI